MTGNLLVRAAIIVGIGVAAGAAHWTFGPTIVARFDPGRNRAPAPKAPDGTGPSDSSIPAVAPEASPISPAPVAAPKLPEGHITLERAKELYDSREQSNTVFIDARRPDLFLAGHVKGAMHLNPDAIRSGNPKLDFLYGVNVVVYCDGAQCEDSTNTAKRLQQRFNQDIGSILIMHDGFPAWLAAGHPTATGPDVEFGG